MVFLLFISYNCVYSIYRIDFVFLHKSNFIYRDLADAFTTTMSVFNIQWIEQF